MSWNVRGLGDSSKCAVVRNTIRMSRCDVICLQETKSNVNHLQYVHDVLPSFFDRQCATLFSNNTAGGCLIAWKRNFQLINSWATRHSISVTLKHTGSGMIFVVSNVYGPTVEGLKWEFLQELRSLQTVVHHRWILLGDFNLVRWYVDRSSELRGFALMTAFNSLISDLALQDIQLENRTYTWSNKRPSPSFSKLDRIMVTTEWTTSYPIIKMRAMDMLVSDHVPLILTCAKLQTKKSPLRIESFWLQYREATELVLRMWSNTTQGSANTAQVFENKTKAVQLALRKWHQNNFSSIELQLQGCRDAILFFDRIEERRKLDQREFHLRLTIKEKAYELANIIEMRWSQRARCRWLQSGDKNTRFFHAYASARARGKAILSIQHDGNTVTDTAQIRQIFLDQMQNLLGREEDVMDFDPKKLYPQQEELGSLEIPFTEHEIATAVRQLAKNRASGPDGLPNEFIQQFWDTLKGDVLQAFNQFYQGQLDLQTINCANIIMVPKSDSPSDANGYRPISVVNLLPKLISKVLSNRLRQFLPDIISTEQTAFIKNRHIAESFLATRELLQHIHKSGQPAIFVKIDFSKAFDSINWQFLMKIMKVRGFPKRWIDWIGSILNTSSSSVIINGEQSERFRHRRGLRQGDPISPMLFLLAVDALQRMIRIANTSLLHPISHRIHDSIKALQYADDTVIIANAGNEFSSIITLKLVLRLFSSISGLHINFKKSCLVPLNLNREECTIVRSIMGCQQASFPITYLGMPLTLNKPSQSAFIPLIEKLERRLEGWKRKLLSRGGRRQLVISVMSAIPVYFMCCFFLPDWVIKRIDKLRRDFLWGKNEGRGVSLMNWPTACLPVEWGGMGIPDLKIQNRALLCRWWWRIYHNPDSLWATTVQELHAIANHIQGPNLFTKEGSFFWKQLHSIKDLFLWSTSWRIGDGMRISFWFDSWCGEPIIRTAERRPIHYRISIREATQLVSEIAPEHEENISAISFNTDQDTVMWNWSCNRLYSSKSLYRVLKGGGRIRWGLQSIWQYRVTPTVRIFGYLMLNERLMTHANLLIRNINCEPRCVMCGVCPLETTVHLMFQCQFAKEVWFRMKQRAPRSITDVTGEVLDIAEVWESFLSRANVNCSRLRELVLCTCWHIWKARNSKIFRDESVTPPVLSERIWMEYTMWCKYC